MNIHMNRKTPIRENTLIGVFLWKNLYDTIRIMHVTGDFFFNFQSSFILEYKKERQKEKQLSA